MLLFLEILERGDKVEFKKINMFTRWKESKLLCACSPDSPCSKYKRCQCQIEELLYDPMQDFRSCINHSSYKRVNGAIKQR